MEITLEHIIEASKRIKGIVKQTPFDYSTPLSDFSGAKFYLKYENLQAVGSFKIRGATNKIKSLTETEKKKGVITASAGNHAQGVAYISRIVGVDAMIVVPENAPLTKIENTKRMGANVVIAGKDYDESESIAYKLEKETGRVFVSAFNDPYVVAGGGTLGLEMLLEQPGLDMLIVPAGGGGLILGVATAAKLISPRIKVIGVQPENSPPWYEAKKQNKYVKVEIFDTLADGLAGDIAADMVEDFNNVVDDVVTVSEKNIAQGIRWMLDKHHTVTEGSAVVGISAVLDRIIDVKGMRVGSIITGCNIDTVKLLEILNGV